MTLASSRGGRLPIPEELRLANGVEQLAQTPADRCCLVLPPQRRVPPP